MVTEKPIVKKTQSQTQSTCAISNPNMKQTETAEYVPLTEVTELSLPTSSTLTPGINMSLQKPIKIIRSKSDIHKYSNKSERFPTEDNSFG